MENIHKKLLLRNIHLLLTFYNYLPENYIDRYHINKNLTDIYEIFDGTILPNQTNLARILRLVGEPLSTLASAKNLLPLIFKHIRGKWHMTRSTLGKIIDFTPKDIKTIEHDYFPQSHFDKVFAEKFGISDKTALAMIYPDMYFNPPKHQKSSSLKMNALILHAIQKLRNEIHREGEDIEWNRDIFDRIEMFFDKLEELRYISGISDDKTLIHTCRHIKKLYESCSNQKKHRHMNYVIFIRIDKILKRLEKDYLSRNQQNYLRSRKFIMINGVHIEDIKNPEDSKIQYSLYGIKHHLNKDTNYHWQSLITRTVTVPGIASLDPTWRQLDYDDGFISDYFHAFSSSSDMNNFIAECSLSRYQVRYIFNFLHSQGLSCNKILPCDQVDWWLNHHNMEYRSVGDEEL